MYNCYRVFDCGRLIAVVENELAADSLVSMILARFESTMPEDLHYEPAFIEGIGF